MLDPYLYILTPSQYDAVIYPPAALTQQRQCLVLSERWVHRRFSRNKGQAIKHYLLFITHKGTHGVVGPMRNELTHGIRYTKKFYLIKLATTSFC